MKPRIPTLAPGRRRARALVVDDAQSLRALVRKVLERSGRYEVIAEADDGQAAIEVAERVGADLDLVVLDLSMPRLDGLGALPSLRRLAPQARIVVLSSFTEATTVDEVIAAGADGYVEKGGRPRELLAALEASSTDAR